MEYETNLNLEAIDGKLRSLGYAKVKLFATNVRISKDPNEETPVACIEYSKGNHFVEVNRYGKGKLTVEHRDFVGGRSSFDSGGRQHPLTEFKPQLLG